MGAYSPTTAAGAASSPAEHATPAPTDGAVLFDQADPRTNGDHVRRVTDGDGAGDVIVTGVVHDHPASAYRVRSVVEGFDPDVLALELPPLAVALFERHADERTASIAGDEMSVGIRAAATDAVVGIDGPSPAFLRRLARNLYRSDVTLATARRVTSGLLSATRRAVACRVATALDASTAERLVVESSVEHDVDRDDDPDAQATDERTQVRQAQSVLNALGKSSAAQVRDATREAHMADRLRSLRQSGSVVAVVGVDHLDPLVERLRS